jgi:Mitochondrial K+-H+ exchange-related
VKIYLLLIDHERFFFYADESAAPDDQSDGVESSGRPGPGIRGWLHGKYQRFLSAWRHGESGAIVWVRRVWDWLHTLTHPDEAMLVRLRSARSIELHYPASRSGNEVREIWRGYLSQEWWRHLLWLSVNGLLAPPTIAILWILPGPNLIGYWFAYRAIHHLLVLWGIRRVWRDVIPTELRAVDALDLPIERDGTGQASHAALGEQPARLSEHVTWHESWRRRGRTSRPAEVARPAEDPRAGTRPDGT